MNFTGLRPREDLLSFLLLALPPLPHYSPHCSVGQSRPRLRRACGIARGARAFSPDKRDGPIKPNSHEFATERLGALRARRQKKKGGTKRRAPMEGRRIRAESVRSVRKRNRSVRISIGGSRLIRRSVRSSRYPETLATREKLFSMLTK